MESQEKGIASVAALRSYLAEASRVAGALRVYVVWAGNEGLPPEREAVVTPDDFGGDGFCLNEPELLNVL